MKREIPELNNLRLVAEWMYKVKTDDEVSYVLKLLYEMSNNAPNWYYETAIPKKSGGERVLSVPKSELKKVQRCIVRGILDKIPTSSCAKAYKKGGSIFDAAEEHVGQKVLLRLDIEGFFDNITFRKVLNCVFGKYYPRKVAGLLSGLCCYRGQLPQGAPTSPAISNIVMKSFDDEIMQFCERNNIKYTRYCDDLIFSGDFDAGAVIKKVKIELYKMGLNLNYDKTKVISQGQRQVALGICVNEKMQAVASYRKMIRQEMYYCKKYTVAEHLLRKKDTRYVRQTKTGVSIDTRGYIEHLKGKISFVLQINPEDEEMQEYMSFLLTK